MLAPNATAVTSCGLRLVPLPSRHGFSTNRYVSTASTSATPDQTSLPTTPMSQLMTAAMPTIGQCQRYQEYDIRPNH